MSPYFPCLSNALALEKGCQLLHAQFGLSGIWPIPTFAKGGYVSATEYLRPLQALLKDPARQPLVMSATPSWGYRDPATMQSVNSPEQGKAFVSNYAQRSLVEAVSPRRVTLSWFVQHKLQAAMGWLKITVVQCAPPPLVSHCQAYRLGWPVLDRLHAVLTPFQLFVARQWDLRLLSADSVHLAGHLNDRLNAQLLLQLLSPRHRYMGTQTVSATLHGKCVVLHSTGVAFFWTWTASTDCEVAV